MRGRFQEYVIASGLSLLLLLLVNIVTYVTKSSLGVFGFVLAPGLLWAAIVFPEGGHSDFAFVYLAAAVLIDTLLLGIPVMLLWRMINRLRTKSLE